ncbi:MAG: rfaD [Segetibacter sp.]|nr:rfaD [Segetibacter sp.]
MSLSEKIAAYLSSEDEPTDDREKGTIIVTGAAGFIGSCVVQYLNEQGYENLILVDDFGVEEKRRNWEGKTYAEIIERYNLMAWLQQHQPKVDFVIHLGARTDTTEFDYAIHQELNVEYSQDLWSYCTANNVPLIYASSAATYGSGELGYDDNHKLVEKLQPLNPYGISKNEFDKWALAQSSTPPFWAGLKFFNVYGPNEYHKARMASVIFHSYNQVKKDGVVKLFKSHKEGFKDGEQLRDFVYVKDVIKVIGWMMDEVQNAKLKVQNSGLYNLGTGKARAFVDLVKATFVGLDKEPNIIYIDMPEDIRDKYQYFTEANMQKLKDAGYPNDFYSLEEGVGDYVRNYLLKDKIY